MTLVQFPVLCCIELGSYTDEEKLQIAKLHILPKQLKKHGLTGANLRVTDDAIRHLIACYTREAGVRELERELAKLCRKTAKFMSEEQARPVKTRYLGGTLSPSQPLKN